MEASTRKSLLHDHDRLHTGTSQIHDFFKRLIYFFYFWLWWVFGAALGLFSSCGEWGLFFIVVCGVLIVVTSLVVERRL